MINTEMVLQISPGVIDHTHRIWGFQTVIKTGLEALNLHDKMTEGECSAARKY